MREALRAERRTTRGAGRWFSAKHYDYPVRVIEPAGLRIAWNWISPGEEKALDQLGERYPVGPVHTERCDWESLDAAQREALIAALWEQGHTREALRAARMHLRVDRRAARAYLREHVEEA